MRNGSATILFVYPLVAFFLVTPLFLASSYAADFSVAQVQASIKSRLADQPPDNAFTIQKSSISGMEMMPLAYRSRAFMPFWIDARLRLDAAKTLAEAIGRAGEDGLRPADYHLAVIYRLLAEMEQARATPHTISPDRLADLDLILTDAFLLLGTHLAIGKVNSDTRLARWEIDPGRVSLLPLLIRAVTTGDVAGALNALRPSHAGYAALRRALAQLRKKASHGGWPKLTAPSVLRPGDRGEGGEALRRRLVAGGDLGPHGQVDDRHRFDDGVAEAVKRFQRRHGLDDDGIVGPDTRRMLNVSVKKRIRQAVINLERWRWLPHQLEPRYIMVNTAAFTLNAVDAGQVVRTMRVVVGRPARRSPVFSSKITYLVVNPYWTVPTTIAVEDILPAVQKDAGYLSKRGFRVYSSWPTDTAQIDPATVNWQATHKDRFPFTLRQDPGPHNALGHFKFMFANAFDIYLHGTPDQTIFKKTQRDVSSGCIRLEDPLILAHFVLSEDARWPAQALKKQVDSGRPLTIKLDHPVPVYILYMTAWADAKGDLQFRGDIYDRDPPLDRALNQTRPRPGPSR